MKTRPGCVKFRKIPVSPCDDYRAGSDGKIYSRTRYAGFGRKERVEWYPLCGTPGSREYLMVSLCHQNKKVTKHIHRLICMAFHGMPPTPQHQTRHLDGNRKNNRPENLAWGTQAENWADRKAHGRGIEGEKHHASKFTNEERRHIQWAIKKGLCSQRHVARALQMAQSSIGGIVHGKWA